jgi:hypothetical protein
MNDPYILPIAMSCFREVWKQDRFSIYTCFCGWFVVDRSRSEAAVLGRFDSFSQAFCYLTGQEWPEPQGGES